MVISILSKLECICEGERERETISIKIIEWKDQINK
jgi:hypothetical protein